MPKEARWSVLKDNAPQPTIGKLVDDATTIERDNPSLQGVFPKDYATLLAFGAGELREEVFIHPSEHVRRAVFRVAESNGQFYTPVHVVRVLVEMP